MKLKLFLLCFFLILLLLVPTVYANPDVAITINSYGTETASQRRMIETSLGVLWKAWSDGTNMRFNVSADDGATWLNAGTVRAAVASRQFAIWHDPDYNISRVWYVYTKNTVSSKWYTARGILNSTQTGISWGTEYSYGSATGSWGYYYGTIICLPYGGLQTCIATVGGAIGCRLTLWKTDSNDASGFTAYTTTYVIGDGVSTAYENSFVPLASSNHTYVIYHRDASAQILYGRRWNGAGFDAAVVLSNFGGSNRTVGQNGVCLSSDGDESYAVWESHVNVTDGSAHECIAYRKINSDNTLGSVTQISLDDQAVNEHGPTISVDSGNDVQAVVWGYSDDLYYRVYREAAWEDIETYNPSYSWVIEYTVNSPWHLPIENEVPMTYQQGINPPLTLYFKMFDITPTGAPTAYTADLSKTWATSWNFETRYNTFATLSQALASSWTVQLSWTASADLTQPLTSTWSLLPQWDSLVDVSQALATTWEVLITRSAIVDLTQTLATSWNFMVQTAFNVDVSQSLVTAWNLFVQASFNIASSLSVATAWVVEALKGTFYMVDLSLALTIAFLVDVATGEAGFLFGIVLFMFALAAGSMLFVLLYADNKANREQEGLEQAYQT